MIYFIYATVLTAKRFSIYVLLYFSWSLSIFFLDGAPEQSFGTEEVDGKSPVTGRTILSYYFLKFLMTTLFYNKIEALHKTRTTV